MNRKGRGNADVLAAVYDFVNGNMSNESTDAQVAEMEELLRGSDDARQLYAELIELTVSLPRALAAVLAEQSVEAFSLGIQGSESSRQQVPQSAISGFPLFDEGPDGGGTLMEPSSFGVGASSAFSYSSPAAESFMGCFSSGWPVAYLVAAVICGVGMLIGTLVHVSSPAQVVRQSVPGSLPLTPSPSSLPFVGRITGMVDCQWADPNTAVPGSVAVPLGRKYALSSGLLEITYNSGAKVILQGPVTYEVESATGGFLSLGKLTARVEKKAEGGGRKAEEVASLPSPDQPSVGARRGAGGEGGEKNGNRSESQRALTLALSQRERGPDSFSPLRLPPSALFSVRTPTATVTDLGTEFGVEVAESGDTSTHVFRGSVEVQPTTVDGKQDGQAVRLNENESAKVEKQSSGESLTVHRGTADAAAFVRSEQLQKPAEEPKPKPFHRWQAYSEKLRHDPSLLAYYDFQQVPGSPAVLRNIAANGDKSFDGTVDNATWSAGRMPGKHALQFNGPDDYVRINVPQKVDNLTLATWVYAYSLDNPLNGILMSDQWGQEGQVHWQINSTNGCVSFGVFGSGSRSKADESAPVFDASRLFRWTHLAVVCDRDAGRIRFYTDGSATGEVDVIECAPIRIGAARIGHWNSATMIDNKATVRSFHGRIDELAIFGRVLSSDDIQRLFEAGKPPDKK